VETNPSNIPIFPVDIRKNKLLVKYHEAIKTDVHIQMFMDVSWVDFHHFLQFSAMLQSDNT